MSERKERTRQRAAKAANREDLQDVTTAEPTSKLRPRKVHSASVVTLANPEALAAKNIAVQFHGDPFFLKISAAFDQGGAKGLLLNNLAVQNGCELVLDSADAIDSADANDSTKDIDLGDLQVLLRTNDDLLEVAPLSNGASTEYDDCFNSNLLAQKWRTFWQYGTRKKESKKNDKEKKPKKAFFIDFLASLPSESHFVTADPRSTTLSAREITAKYPTTLPSEPAFDDASLTQLFTKPLQIFSRSPESELPGAAIEAKNLEYTRAEPDDDRRRKVRKMVEQCQFLSVNAD